MKIGDRIKQLREEANMGRAELAQKIGVTYHALSKYETNERQPDYETLKKIANLFNVSTDYLLGHSNIRNPYDKTCNTYDKLGIDELSPESKEELKKFIELLKIKDKMEKIKDKKSSVSNSNT